MVDEYIKRNDVLKFSEIFDDKIWETGGYRIRSVDAVPVDTIKELPAEDVVPKELFDNAFNTICSAYQSHGDCKKILETYLLENACCAE